MPFTDFLDRMVVLDPEKMYGNLDKIINRPYGFLPNADPKMRTYSKHMMNNAPMVMIRPGRIKFSKDVTAFITKALKSFDESISPDMAKEMVKTQQKNGIFGSEYGVTKQDKEALKKAIAEKQKGTVRDWETGDTDSLRYFEFDTSFQIIREYQSVLHTLSSRLFSRMVNAPWIPWEKSWQPVTGNNGGFYTFWAENSTSITESASSEVGATKLAGLVKGVSDVKKEVDYLTGSGLSKSESQTGMLNSAIEGVSSIISGGGEGNQVRGALGDAILGFNPLFPEVWKDSSFSRSYNLSFKFHSPYGHQAAIYQNVLQPFLMLLSMVMPVMAAKGSYSQPFVFQMDCPGYFACDLGICTDFSFVKGGSDNLWTHDGLPRQIDVTMSVKDLYPVLMASNNTRSMYFNVGMGTFLDNLAGISLFRSDLGRGSIINRARAAVANTAMSIQGLEQGAEYSVQNFMENTGVAGAVRTVAQVVSLFQQK